MPKSKLRGGTKAHKTRVETRNNLLRGLRKKAQAEYTEMFEKQMEALKVQYQNENGETTELGADVIADVTDINLTDVEVVTPEVIDEN
jgi:nitrate reductase assembly molybdenum cofactor insertion protein NarJ